MTVLQSDLQVIVWTWTSSGYRCDGYLSVPSAMPAFILLFPAGPTSENACERIGRQLASSIRTLPGVSVSPEVPCGPALRPLGSGCHAMNSPGARKLLVVVGDPAANLRQRPRELENWPVPGDDTFRLLSVLPAGTQPSACLPAEWAYHESAFWVNTPDEAVPAILRAAGVDENSRRVFVSYVRNETSEVAEQLFDELGRRNFDVYVDRFRGTPGVDFRQTLVRELAHKSMLVLLGTPAVLQSQWTLFEILFARLYGLGILALDAAAAFAGQSVVRPLRLLSNEVVVLQGSEIRHHAPRLELTDAAVSKFADAVVAAHTQRLLARRQRLVLSVDALLRYVGAHVVEVDPAGRILAQSNGGAKSYSICIVPRPAELADFHRSHCAAMAATARPVVAAPAAWLMGSERATMEWLEDVSDVPLVEEGDWLRAAREIRAGQL